MAKEIDLQSDDSDVSTLSLTEAGTVLGTVGGVMMAEGLPETPGPR